MRNKWLFFFDIGNVMINFDLEQLQSRISEESSIPYEKIRENWHNENLIAVETGKLTGHEYFSRFIKSILPYWTYEDWIQAWMDIYTINSNGRSLFLDVKRKGYPVYILSNLAEYNKIGIEQKFPNFFEESTENFFSYELGLHKPDIRIYQTVCDCLGVPPKNCIFIDDTLANVQGAEETGMKGICFSNDKFSSISEAIDKFISFSKKF